MKKFYFALVLAVILAFIASCAAGDARFAVQPAGFFYGLWHGAISLVSLVIQIFSDSVVMYESHNTGGWYDFGFFLGATTIWGHSSKHGYEKAKFSMDKEWHSISEKVEEKIMEELKKWIDAEDDLEWEELRDKIKKKLKRKLKEWADEE